MEYTELIWDRYLDSFDSELTELWDLMGSSLLRSAPSARVAILKKLFRAFRIPAGSCSCGYFNRGPVRKALTDLNIPVTAFSIPLRT